MAHLEIEKFINTLSCPLCKSALNMLGNRLICSNSHCFDIAKSGYVNLIPNHSNSSVYSKNSFFHRSAILENGMYDHILKDIETLILNNKIRGTIVDAGCGEGYFSRCLSKNTKNNLIALDISKDSIYLASKLKKSINQLYLVADIANIPLKDSSIDLILNIFAPANYSEFSRVLKGNAFLIKVVPNSEHLKELRELSKLESEYSNSDTVNKFCSEIVLLNKLKSSKTYTIDSEKAKSFIKMSPLLFNKEIDNIDVSLLNKLTISADILLGIVKK